jgi:ubiquinone/menaquinone biosynthesis C-methylase UbiE
MGALYDATWGRGFAALYERGLRASEEAGLRQMRRELLAEVRGNTIELGAGTGANLDLYPAAVGELVLTEPDPHMTARLRPKLAAREGVVELVEAPGERLPYDDSSFDTAVLTLVLCTVPDPAETLAEVARVLRPGGQMLFIEHVRSGDPALARWQDRLEAPWRFVGDGCHCNRDTIAAIEASPLSLGRLGHDRLPRAFPIVRPLVRGSAGLPA